LSKRETLDLGLPNLVFPLKIVKNIEKILRGIDKKIMGRYPGKGGTQFPRLTVVLSQLLSAKKFPDEKNVVHVEIGTLHGGSAIAMLSVLRKHKIRNQKLVCIDPMETLKETIWHGVDYTSGVEVSSEVFWRNIKNFGFSEDDVTLFISKSNNKKIIEKLKGYSVPSVFIDGHHGYKSVKNDWLMYSPLVGTGGMVIFDDYREGKKVRYDKGWVQEGVGVKKFVDGELERFLGKSWVRLGNIYKVYVLERVD